MHTSGMLTAQVRQALRRPSEHGGGSLPCMTWKQWRGRLRVKRKRRQRIKELIEFRSRSYDQTIGSLPSDAENDVVDQEVAHFESLTEHTDDEIDWLRQKNLLSSARSAGVEIPADAWDQSEQRNFAVLTASGEWKLRKELRKHRDLRIEFWAKIVLPIASLIVSIIALLKKK